MEKVKMIVRILLGLMILVFGMNKFLNFMPMPPMPDEAAAFMGALVNSGYLMIVVALVEVVTGVLLLINKYQALALIVLFPVLLNAFMFHLFLDPSGIAGAALALIMNIYLLFANKSKYSELLKP
jgi:uncharacterized membrane protein YphA (DoxX/SURF4 family)